MFIHVHSFPFQSRRKGHQGHGSKDYHLSGATITTDADGICREHRLDESVEVARPKVRDTSNGAALQCVANSGE